MDVPELHQRYIYFQVDIKYVVINITDSSFRPAVKYPEPGWKPALMAMLQGMIVPVLFANRVTTSSERPVRRNHPDIQLHR